MIVMVRLHARAEQIDAASGALSKIAAPTRTNPDCLEFRIFQHGEDPQTFILLERWVSLAANMAHAERDYMADYMAQKDDLFESIDGEFVDEMHRPDARFEHA